MISLPAPYISVESGFTMARQYVCGNLKKGVTDYCEDLVLVDNFTELGRRNAMISYPGILNRRIRYAFAQNILSMLEDRCFFMIARNIEILREFKAIVPVVSILFLVNPEDFLEFFLKNKGALCSQSMDQYKRVYSIYRERRNEFDYVIDFGEYKDLFSLNSGLALNVIERVAQRLKTILKNWLEPTADSLSSSLVCEVDANDLFLRPIARRTAHPREEGAINLPIHRCVTVFVFNSEGKILMVRRSRFKKNPFLMQAIPSGHVDFLDFEISMEDTDSCYRRSAARELHEEVFPTHFLLNSRIRRLFIPDENGVEKAFFRAYDQGNQRENYALFMLKLTKAEEGRVIVGYEAQWMEWMDVDEVMRMIKDDPEKFRGPFAQMFTRVYPKLKMMLNTR